MRAHRPTFRPSIEHGGEIRSGRRKIARPIVLKRPLHLVLRASMARGPRSMLAPAHERRVRAIVDRASDKYGIRVYRYVNVGNHLHLLVQTRTRPAFQGFLREIAGRIAMLVTGARKSFPIESVTEPSEGKPAGRRRAPGAKRFWDLLAYTRVVSWGRDFAGLKHYFIKNHFEAAGLLTRRMKAAGVQVVSLTRGVGPPPGWGVPRLASGEGPISAGEGPLSTRASGRRRS